jgi:hypothetical protein
MKLRIARLRNWEIYKWPAHGTGTAGVSPAPFGADVLLAF